LKLRAKKDFVRSGVQVTTGQEYLHKQDGAYLPEVTEEVVETINATILTDKKALHLRAKESFKVSSVPKSLHSSRCDSLLIFSGSIWNTKTRWRRMVGHSSKC
jgi:hypothetical protein